MAKPTKVVEVETLEDVLEELAEKAVAIDEVQEETEAVAITPDVEQGNLYEQAAHIAYRLTKMDGSTHEFLGFDGDPNEQEQLVSLVVDQLVLDRNDLADDFMFSELHVQKLREQLDDARYENEMNEEAMATVLGELDQRLKIAVAFGIGATAFGAIGLIAYLRERKVRKSLIRMIEEFSKDLLSFLGNDVHAVSLEAYCSRITQLLLGQHVRSLTNPFGVKPKEAEHVMSLLNAIVSIVEDVKLSQLHVAPVNPEDIEAQVVTEPVVVEATEVEEEIAPPQPEAAPKKQSKPKAAKPKNTKPQPPPNKSETEES